MIGLVAGFFGGVTDGVLSRLLDVVWAFPVYLLAICLSTVLITGGFAVGPLRLESGSLLLPIFIIGIVYVPYVARPIRGEVLSLRADASSSRPRSGSARRTGACSGARSCRT